MGGGARARERESSYAREKESERANERSCSRERESAHERGHERTREPEKERMRQEERKGERGHVSERSRDQEIEKAPRNILVGSHIHCTSVTTIYKVYILELPQLFFLYLYRLSKII